MLVQTRHFGEIDLDEAKVLEFESGILGFEECKKYTLLYDNEKDDSPVISWLQSLDEPSLALPVVSPALVKPDYDPVVEDELLNTIGELTDDNLVILLTLTVPSDISKMTSNLKAPIIINSETKKGCQVIAENEDYMIKYGVYDTFLKYKEAYANS